MQPKRPSKTAPRAGAPGRKPQPSPLGRAALVLALVAVPAGVWGLTRGGSDGTGPSSGAPSTATSASAPAAVTTAASVKPPPAGPSVARASTAASSSASSLERPGLEPSIDVEGIRGAGKGDGSPVVGGLTPPDASPAAEKVASGLKLCDPAARFPEISERVPTPKSLEWATVDRVIDGDTLHTTEGDKVRLIGINTMEKGQPMSKEATEFLASLVRGKKVGFEVDVEAHDMYKRRLCYVYVDGRFVNGEMARRGFAHAYRWEPNVKYAKQFVDFQRAARADGYGIWSLPKPEPASAYVTEIEGHIFHRAECAIARRVDARKRLELPTRDAAYDSGRKACDSCKP